MSTFTILLFSIEKVIHFIYCIAMHLWQHMGVEGSTDTMCFTPSSLSSPS